MTKPRKVTREIANCIYKSYEALRLNEVKPYEAFETIQSDVLDGFGVEIGLATVHAYSHQTFDNLKETQIRYGQRKKLGLVGLERESPKSDKVLSLIKNKPSTYEEIGRELGEPQSHVGRLINHLKMKGKVQNVFITSGRRSSTTIKSRELFDGITAHSIVYVPGDEKRLGEKLTEYLPKELTRGMRKSLTRRLRDVLPKEAYEIVQKYMCEHAVK